MVRAETGVARCCGYHLHKLVQLVQLLGSSAKVSRIMPPAGPTPLETTLLQIERYIETHGTGEA
jgi:hypothetical protein